MNGHVLEMALIAHLAKAAKEAAKEDNCVVRLQLN